MNEDIHQLACGKPAYEEKLKAANELKKVKAERKALDEKLWTSITMSQIGDADVKRVEELRKKYAAGMMTRMVKTVGGADDVTSKAPTSIEGAVKELISSLWKAERASSGSSAVLGGLPEGKTMLKKPSGELAKEACKEQVSMASSLAALLS